MTTEQPIALDLCCGLGGWASGPMAAGWSVIGFDTESFYVSTYPARCYQKDVRTLDGIALRHEYHPSLIVASPPCQQFSRHDQPWTPRRNPPPPDLSIWRACERIAAETGAPLIIENVRGAQPFVGSARTHIGAYYLWGDAPALLPDIPAPRPKESRSSNRQAHRSKIPFDIAYYIGTVFL